MQKQIRRNPKRRNKSPDPGYKSAEDWLHEARKFLTQKGIAEVKVEPIARSLGVTAGSFYWHYQNRQELHKALLREWLHSNVEPFHKAYQYSDDPKDQYLALAYVWLLCPDFDPGLDVAVREWSRSSALVERTLRFVDNKRIGLYQHIFEAIGYSKNSALVRARTFYYHQIGYYAMRIIDDIDHRLMLVPYYAELFLGDDWLTDIQEPDAIRDLLMKYRQ